jgi:glutathione S-transferase
MITFASFKRRRRNMATRPDPNTTLELSRDFKAERERVFAAFLDPTVLQTIWSTDAYKIVEMTVDARVGGGWSFAMRDQATGSVGHCTASYLEIERPVRIMWLTKWLDGPLAGAPEMRVTLEFSSIRGGTRLHLTHEFFPDQQTRDHHGAGWASGLERLAGLLAGELAK